MSCKNIQIGKPFQRLWRAVNLTIGSRRSCNRQTRRKLRTTATAVTMRWKWTKLDENGRIWVKMEIFWIEINSFGMKMEKFGFRRDWGLLRTVRVETISLPIALLSGEHFAIWVFFRISGEMRWSIALKDPWALVMAHTAWAHQEGQALITLRTQVFFLQRLFINSTISTSSYLSQLRAFSCSVRGQSLPRTTRCLIILIIIVLFACSLSLSHSLPSFSSKMPSTLYVPWNNDWKEGWLSWLMPKILWTSSSLSLSSLNWWSQLPWSSLSSSWWSSS